MNIPKHQISVLLLLIGSLTDGIYCVNVGLISPIEVVEEWGCYDSEIRLTCGHLDSRIAILEAVFAPNCTQKDCFRVDLKRLARAFSPHHYNVDPRVAETEAGRKFLETLRKTHLKQNVDDTDEGVLDDGDDYLEDYGVGERSRDYHRVDPQADHLVSHKGKKTSLRASLERLIIKYLRKLSPNDDYDYETKLKKRSIRSPARGADAKSDGPERIVLGVRNITVEEGELKDEASEERYRKFLESRSYCPEQRRKIAALDQFDIDKALKNESDHEHNIRRVLNRRCSGKNHCSFLFAVDHPLAVLWDSGIVRLKYICMEEFRVNRYCNEQLTIGNEVMPRTRNIHPVMGEPIAEARVQTRDQHFHSLKILTTNDDTEPVLGHEESPTTADGNKRRKLQKLQIHKPLESQPAQGVYSQDFRLLKILPSNEDSNTIEKIYFRTDDEILDSSHATTMSSSQDTNQSQTTSGNDEIPLDTSVSSSTLPLSRHSGRGTIPTSTTTQMHKEQIHLSTPDSGSDGGELDSDDDLFQNFNYNISKFENVTLIIREGEEYSLMFPKPRMLDNLTVNLSETTTSSISTTSTKTTIILPLEPTTATNQTPISAISTTTVENVLLHPATSDSSVESASNQDEHTDVESRVAVSEMPSSHQHPHRDSTTKLYEFIENEIEVAPTDIYSVATPNRDRGFGKDNRFVDSDDFYNESEESDEDYGDSSRRTYKSSQKTVPRRPLLQGFIISPGYPQFYIGESECRTRITAPHGQRIRVTILDISLRYGPSMCKDFVNIIDARGDQSLFNSCAESIRPSEVISHSNQIEIIFKTRTKFAYPKRGILMHYSAMGCLTPSAPLNGFLVERTDRVALFRCISGFVFPDSGIHIQQLLCNNNIWDRILPDCVEKLAVAGSGLISNLNYGSRKKVDMTSTPEVIKDADMVYDIIIPSVLIAGLFVINGIIFFIIMMFRKRRNNNLEPEGKELAEL